MSEFLSAFLWRGISVYKHSMLPKKKDTFNDAVWEIAYKPM